MAKVNEPSITIHFSVSEISKITSVLSSEVLLYGIPWQIKLKKYENGTDKSLAAYLNCMNKDNTSNWTATACATIKLLPFRDGQKVVEHHISPLVFNRLNTDYGTNTLIQWDDLFDVGKEYVKNDTIQLEAKIDAEDPNSTMTMSVKLVSATENVTLETWYRGIKW